MNATVLRGQDWLRDVLRIGVHTMQPEWKGPPHRVVPAGDVFYLAGLGFVIFGGYFPKDARLRKQAGVLHQQRRFHAQAPSGDLQSSASFAPYCKRSQWRATQLSVLFRNDRTLAGSRSPSAALARHVAMHVVRPHRPIYCRRRLTISERVAPVGDVILPGHLAHCHSRQSPGVIALWGSEHSGSSAPRSRIRLSRIFGESTARCTYYRYSPSRGRGIVA